MIHGLCSHFAFAALKRLEVLGGCWGLVKAQWNGQNPAFQKGGYDFVSNRCGPEADQKKTPLF
jgi:putative component of membrane protein insertase Oxa1/YidC/SpoIIIJ protein YidD